MSCELTSGSLHGYLDGELDAVRASEFERHLETCPECLRELEAQESLRLQFPETFWTRFEVALEFGGTYGVEFAVQISVQ